MRRRSTSNQKPTTNKVNFRHQVDPNSPLGQIYNSVGKTPEQKKLIGESLVNSLLPYAYKDQNPELAREAAQSSIRKLFDWITMLQLDFGLDDDLIVSRPGRFNFPFAERFIEELQLLRQAFTEESLLVAELKLIRQAIQSNGGVVLTNSSTSVSYPNSESVDMEMFIEGDNFLSNLEEVL